MPHLEFPIPVQDLDAAGKQYRFPIRAAWVRGALEATTVTPSGTDGEVDVRVSKSGRDVVIRGTVRAELTVPCARCLEPAPVSVREELSALAVAGSASTGAASSKGGKRRDDAEDDEQDLLLHEADTIPYDGDTVVLDELVRDEILLGIPMIPLCSDDCPGIRLQPAAVEDAVTREEADLDPRLQPLLRLKKT